MDIWTGILLFIIGVISGGYGTIVGAGGGFIFVPALLIILNVNPVIASGSGLVVVLINSITGTHGYAKQKKINYNMAFIIGISAFPGSFLGVWLLQNYSSQYFYFIFSIMLFLLGLFLFFANSPISFNKNTSSKKVINRPKNTWLIPLGFLMGILSSYLGIGGGWLLVPILIYIFKIPIHQAAATSIFSLLLYSSVGVVSQIYYNNVDWGIVLLGGLGVFLGANIGVSLSRRISGKKILQMLSVLLLIISIRLFIQ